MAGLLGILFRQKKAVIDYRDGSSGALNTGIGVLETALDQNVGGVAGIVIDATVSEDHNSSCNVTDNPVEDGAKVTDHVQLKPAELTIQGVITDAPLGFAVIGNIQQVRNIIQGQSARSIDAYNDLLALQKSRRPFTVLTSLKRYENMILVDLSVPRTAQTGRSIHFSAKMKQIRIVENLITGISRSNIPGLAKATRNVGQQVTDAVPSSNPLSSSPSSTTTGNQSLLSSLRNGKNVFGDLVAPRNR